MSDDFVELDPALLTKLNPFGGTIPAGAPLRALNFPDQAPPGMVITRTHNEPPLEEMLPEDTADLVKRRDELLGSVSRVPDTIVDEITNKRATDLVKLITTCCTNIEDRREDRKKPFLEAGRLVDRHYKAIAEPLDAAKKKVTAKMTAYQIAQAAAEKKAREEQARKAAEEARRQAEEAAAAAAALTTEADLDAAIEAEEAARIAAEQAELAQRATTAPVAELSRTRGGVGVASLQTRWTFTDLDLENLDLLELRPYLPYDAIEKAIRAFIRGGGRELRGVRIFADQQTRVR